MTLSAKPLWQPDSARIQNSRLSRFQRTAEERYGRSFQNYQALHQWSIEQPEEFWAHVWSFCEVLANTPYTKVCEHLDRFPGTEWFAGSRLNFAENLLKRRDEHIALIGLLENGERTTLTYRELYEQVSKLATALKIQGVTAGDRVAGYMPNIPETVIAMLATTSIGAIWSSCSPDFGVSAATDRLGQIKPKLLIAANGYVYNGKLVSCMEKVSLLQQAIPSLEQTVIVPLVEMSADADKHAQTVDWHTYLQHDISTPLTFAPLLFDHPLYILYSSGTTGIPKCIVHGAGGTLLQHLKEHQLHTNLGPEDTLFYFTTCGWMMWNWLISGLATGATLVLYDGSPFAHDGNVLLDAIDREQISVFGTSAKFLSALEKAGKKPKQSHQLDSLHTILSTGSALSANSFEYVYRDFKTDVCLSSISGGTDIVSCFALGNPNLPVYAGEIQCKGLGMAVDFLSSEHSDHHSGELVCTQPFPSTPLGFWNDDTGKRFHNAYFADNPGMWTHGDRGEITSNGGIIIHGRSDTTLNPAGVRIGTAEIYRQVEKLEAVVDSVVVGQQWQEDERVVLFVVLQSGVDLSEMLEQEIRQVIRSNTTPRHVPAKIIAVPDIPRTISGKVVEIAVRKVIHGEEVENKGALANPETLSYFEGLKSLQS